MEVEFTSSVPVQFEMVTDSQGATIIMEDRDEMMHCTSLCSGSFSTSGVTITRNVSLSDDEEPSKRTFFRSSSSFMRVSDLQLPRSVNGTADDEPHYHRVSDQPPPGAEYDHNESWVALDDGVGSHAPIAPYAVEALFQRGFKLITDESVWIPDKSTKKILKNGMQLHSKEVLIWTCEKLLSQGQYGHDIPGVRSRGYIHMSPESLVSLLVDSNRVKEYNKLSLGRSDEVVFNESLHISTGPFPNTVTKIVKSSNKPPVVPKTLQFRTLLHCRRLTLEEHGVDGFIIVSRSLTSSEMSDDDAIEGEILLNVHLITRVDGHFDWSVLTNINHMKSPMVPAFIARRLGLSAAVSFIKDIMALC